MKKILVIMATGLLFSACGGMEKIYDKQNYESLSNEKGTVQFYSGGKLVKEYKNATIIYSSSDTQAMFIETNEGRKKYLQGDIIIDL